MQEQRLVSAYPRRAGFSVWFLILCAAIAVLAAVPEARADKSGVTIRNDKFEVIKVLTKRKDTSAFQTIWKQKKQTSASLVLDWSYKIDFADGSRWLYDPRGYAMLVSTKHVPLYRIPQPGRFNALLGAKRKPAN
jgi:hypothetical protein